MANELTKAPLHFELGDYLEVLRYVQPVHDKYLTIRDVCKLAAMSRSTYKKVKKGIVRI